MGSSTTPYNPANSTNSWQQCAPTLVIIGGLALSSISTPLSAAETSYRAYEGLSHQTEQAGTNFTPAVGVSTLTGAMRSAPSNDNHLTLNPQHVLWFDGGIWISNIGTSLYIDNDQDGYFSAFSLTIDADTDYSQADVYATIDIRRSGGERETLHTTGTFSIYGNSLSGEYRVDIELVRNYPIGDYDLFINLVDANNHALVDRVGPNDISNLSRLPLESEELDNVPAPYTSGAPDHTPTINTDIRVVEHSGSSSTWLLLALGIPVIVRYLKNTKSNRKANSGGGLSSSRAAASISGHNSHYHLISGVQPFAWPDRIMRVIRRTKAHYFWNRDFIDDGKLPGSTSTLTS